MIEYALNIGEVVTSSGNVRYTCFGLGSCIGLFIQDRVTGLSAGAHIFLPDAEDADLISDGTKFYSVSSAITHILNQLHLKGSSLNTLRAKITGGASVINANMEAGEKNIQSVLASLKSNGIYIAATDVGGRYCRTAQFESKTGLLTVRKSEIGLIENF